jgi:hypothetical protein
MLLGLLPVMTAALATLGAMGVASTEGSGVSVLVVVAAVALLLWADVLLLAGSGERRPHRALYIAYPVGSIATCGAAVWGMLLVTTLEPAPTTILVAAAWIGGGALRLVVGTGAVLLVARRLPGSVGHRVREALATMR